MVRLHGGKPPSLDELDALLDFDPNRALKAIQDARARAVSDDACLAALEARALAFLAFPQRARQRLEEARTSSRTTRDEVAILVSECAIRMVEGDSTGALTTAKQGIDKHPGELGLPLRRTLSWISVSLLRYEELLRDTPEALALAERSGDIRAILALRNNEAVALLETGRIEDARDGLAYVLTLAQRNGHDAVYRSAIHNLAVISARLGDISSALEQFAETRRAITAKDLLALTSLDESETLMDVGLFEEAWKAARRAEHAAMAMSNELNVLQAVELQARASAATGRWGRAYEESARLKQQLTELTSNPSTSTTAYQGRADALRTLAKARLDPHECASHLRSYPVTASLSGGNPRLAVELAGLLEGAGHEDLSTRLLVEAVTDQPTRPSAIGELYASIAAALLAGRRQSPTAESDALVAVESALDFLDLLPSVETRLEVDRAIHHVVPILAEAYVERNELETLQTLLERVQLRSQRVEAIASAEENSLLRQLRESTRVLQRLDQSSKDTMRFARRQTEILNELHRIRRLTERGSIEPSEHAPDFGPHLCYLTVSGDRLYGVRELPNSPRQLVAIDGVQQLRREIGAFRSILENHAYKRPSNDWRELRNRIQRRLAPLLDTFADATVFVVADRTMPVIPWLAISPNPVSAIPTRAVLNNRRHATRIEQVVAVAGPGLESADREIAALRPIYEDRLVSFSSDESYVADVLDALTDASLVHLACHGSIRTDQVLISSLQLSDGPLTMFDLLRDGFPSYAILAACNVGRTLGDTRTALAATLLSRGCRAFVASVGALNDQDAYTAMPNIHKGLTTGGDFITTVHTAIHGLIDEAPSLGNLFICGPG